MSTELYERTIAFDYDGDEDRKDLMRKVWEPTPWMLDAFTGPCDQPRERDMIMWCYDTFGEQSSPIHERSGTWYRGSATVNGWTWFGFSTKDAMEQFTARWPTPPSDSAEKPGAPSAAMQTTSTGE